MYILKPAAQIVRRSPWQHKQSLDKPLDVHGLFYLVEMYSRVNGFVTRDYIYQLERPNLIDTLTYTLAMMWARGNSSGVDSSES